MMVSPFAIEHQDKLRSSKKYMQSLLQKQLKDHHRCKQEISRLPRHHV